MSKEDKGRFLACGGCAIIITPDGSIEPTLFEKLAKWLSHWKRC